MDTWLINVKQHSFKRREGKASQQSTCPTSAATESAWAIAVLRSYATQAG